MPSCCILDKSYPIIREKRRTSEWVALKIPYVVPQAVYFHANGGTLVNLRLLKGIIGDAYTYIYIYRGVYKDFYQVYLVYLYKNLIRIFWRYCGDMFTDCMWHFTKACCIHYLRSSENTQGRCLTSHFCWGPIL